MCSQNRRFAVEKASSVAAKSERARRFRDARAFSGIAVAAARKRMSGVNGMEMSVRAARKKRNTRTTETGTDSEKGEEERRIGEGGRESGESAETEEEKHERRNGRGKQDEEDTTTSGGEEHRGTEHKSRVTSGLRRGRRAREEPPLVPASSQTNGPSPDAEESRAFCTARFKFTFTD